MRTPEIRPWHWNRLINDGIKDHNPQTSRSLHQRHREAILACDTESRLRDRSGCKLKPIRIRQSQYLNNRIEQDHRAVKRRVRSMLGFKSADNARVILGGIELVHMLRKQQAKYVYNQQLSLAEQFHLLAA